MKTNILVAIKNLVKNPILKVKEFYGSKNRANSMGDSLEEYVKDLFAGTINEKSNTKRLSLISECFSYLGNQNNPPDSIIRSGDAIEVKKVESMNSSLALNSSYPKHKLFANSPMITEACKNCEKWDIKDIIYVIGAVSNDSLCQLSMVYGEDYAASEEIYERIRLAIKNGVEQIPNIEFSPSKELGHVNKVDPLGITYLRVRGMWGIGNPNKVFDYVYEPAYGTEFNFFCIINDGKYKSFPLSDRKEIEALTLTNKSFSISDVQIKDPDNPALLRKAKLFIFACGDDLE